MACAFMSLCIVDTHPITGRPTGHDWIQCGGAKEHESSDRQRAGGTESVSLCV